LNLARFVSDYDTNKTVQCSSSFVYDKSRQRSLQHFIEFEELPEKKRNIVLPSGNMAQCYKQCFWRFLPILGVKLAFFFFKI
jgi:hypothetical protein